MKGKNELKTHWGKKPYQGCDPKTARIWLIGFAANFPDNMTNDDWRLLTDYLREPQEFMAEYGVHHPFVHSEWSQISRGGIRYHRRLADMGLSTKIWQKTALVEILPSIIIGGGSRHPVKKKHGATHLKPETGHSHLQLIILTTSAVNSLKMSIRRSTFGLPQGMQGQAGDSWRLRNAKIMIVPHFSGPNFSKAYQDMVKAAMRAAFK